MALSTAISLKFGICKYTAPQRSRSRDNEPLSSQFLARPTPGDPGTATLPPPYNATLANELEEDDEDTVTLGNAPPNDSDHSQSRPTR
ncbi:hypothetical protein QBC40DRAFT_249461 [Triangularia verruculosa]|uniref:Uncharacterized protein n=1 Tax=Triangularia verruculosa TaxID=2587418 RepID=A0AAN7AXJ0_9PEZI|nr:hypothetical protein QBC40DRAFT_249461 [Triangularia verruculosa]